MTRSTMRNHGIGWLLAAALAAGASSCVKKLEDTALCGDGVVDASEKCDGDAGLAGCYSGALRCEADCTLDYADCSGWCGDGVVQSVEECDGAEMTETCHVGLMLCREDCTLDRNGCEAWCGDGVRNAGEECDGPDLPMQCHDGHGTMRCSADCRLDDSSCFAYCGDGTINGPELCDTDAFDVACNTGKLRCSPTCMSLDTAACTGGYCGDAMIQLGEQCDGAAFRTSCYEGSFNCIDCFLVTGACGSWCGDGRQNGAEACDGDDLPVQCHAGVISCTAGCDLDLQQCAGGFCGDGVINGQEECDGGTLPVGCAAGQLTCNGDCTLNAGQCSAYCGDGKRDTGEACDGEELPVCHHGTVQCRGDCQLNTTSCAGGYCGDGIRNGAEECDGADMPQRCHGDHGVMRCTSDCRLDDTACFAYCGDGKLDSPEEVCDGTDFSIACNTGSLTCNASCTAVDTSACTGGFCGDSAIQVGEECDGTSFRTSCYTGSFTCGADCDVLPGGCGGWCGDGVRDGPEECDGNDIGEICHDGTLVCRGDCTLDRSGCQARCGDGVRNGGEECDGADLPVICHAGQGVMRCAADCRLDDSSCFGYCGDQILNGPEVCDGTAFSIACNTGSLGCNATCTAVDTSACTGGSCGDSTIQVGEECDGTSFRTSCYTGSFTCDADCDVLTGGCGGWCGDGVRNGSEQCDGDDIPETCHAGAIVCRPDCTLDRSGCQAWCGDGVRNGGEECDGAGNIPISCHAGSGVMRCAADCRLEVGSCFAYCGDGTINGPEQCDGDDYPIDCTSGTLWCNPTCTHLDTSRCTAGTMLVPTCGEPEMLNPNEDSDGDGVINAVDRCPGYVDAADQDADTVPDGCDLCPGQNDTADGDGDGLPDACDSTPTVPDWARTATVGGLGLFRDGTAAEIGAALEGLKAQNVTVVQADSDLSNYLTDADYAQEMALATTTAQLAHDRGMRIVWFYPTLEVITPDGRINASSMAKDHPDWLQVSIDGTQNVFYGDLALWVGPDGESAWLDPLSGYRDHFLARVRQLVATGVDGIWLDVPLFNNIVGWWASRNPASVERFRADTGLAMPTEASPSDPAWWPWVQWRHQILMEFIEEVHAEARAVNPAVQVIIETVTMDYNAAFIEGLDASFSTPREGLSFVWEVDVTSETDGMIYAHPNDWISLITMMKFGRGADRTAPSWAFTYGNQTVDAELVMAEAIAAQNNPYELKAPEMGSTVGACFRRQAFGWLRRNSDLLFRSQPAGRVAILHSAASRDIVDGPCVLSGECGMGTFFTATRPAAMRPEATWWAAEEAESLARLSYLAEFRGMVKAVVHLHHPFDILVSRQVTQADLARYTTVLLPDLQALSDQEAQAVTGYVAGGGRVLLTGPAPGSMTTVAGPRSPSALNALLGSGVAADACGTVGHGAGSATYCNWRVGKRYLETNDAGALQQVEQVAVAGGALVQTNAPHNVHFELYQRNDRLLLHVVNFVGVNGTVTVVPQQFRVSVDISALGTVSRVVATTPSETRVLDFAMTGGRVEFDVAVGAHVAVVVTR